MCTDLILSSDQTALQTLVPLSDMPESLDRTQDGDAGLIGRLKDILGEFFAEKVISRGDRTWATGIVQSVHS